MYWQTELLHTNKIHSLLLFCCSWWWCFKQFLLFFCGTRGQISIPLTRDASSVMLNSCKVCSTRIKEFTRVWSLISAMSSYICAVIGQSASRAIQWCKRWSLTKQPYRNRNKNKAKLISPFYEMFLLPLFLAFQIGLPFSPRIIIRWRRGE